MCLVQQPVLTANAQIVQMKADNKLIASVLYITDGRFFAK
jgi:hypothetical protein